jgi:hypothetical protein
MTKREKRLILSTVLYIAGAALLVTVGWKTLIGVYLLIAAYSAERSVEAMR